MIRYPIRRPVPLEPRRAGRRPRVRTTVAAVGSPAAPARPRGPTSPVMIVAGTAACRQDRAPRPPARPACVPDVAAQASQAAVQRHRAVRDASLTRADLDSLGARPATPPPSTRVGPGRRRARRRAVPARLGQSTGRVAGGGRAGVALPPPPEGRWRAASTAAPTRTVNTECPSPHVLSGVRVWCRMGEPKADPARDLHLRTPAGCHTPPSPTINNVVSGRPRDVRQRPPECSGSGTIAGSPARRPADPQRHFSACD
jgi:hypothetical protein